MNHNLEMFINNAERATSAAEALGIVLPAPIVEARAVFDAVSAYEPAAPEAEAITLKNYAKVIERRALAEAVKLPSLVAKDAVMDETGRHLLGAVQAHADVLLAAAADGFTTLAAEFTAAHRKLPGRWTDPATLVAAGSHTLVVYEAATRAREQLDVYRQLRTGLAEIGRVATPAGPLEAATRFLRVADSTVADEARQVRSGPLGHWGGWLDIEGTELAWWPSIAAHAAYMASIPQAGLRAVKVPA